MKKPLSSTSNSISNFELPNDVLRDFANLKISEKGNKPISNCQQIT